ncbi:DUF6531 domain-containing protein [Solirubrobacter soli]|uniref:DUF6531 domain-containing protein n=1 Tax=Solirubrobacter soli TaxID=363832 RepID=UPI00040FECCD|nr:DUF6531 domain-containing protein [Solirubrobacter soli]
MGTSSARPDDLDRFAAQSRRADDALRAHDRRLRSDYAGFLSGTEWGVLDIRSLLAGFGTFVDYNEIDARWVAKIAQAFRHAGGDGQVKTLPDSAIHASLKAAGLLGGRRHVTFDDPVAYGMPPTTGYANDPVNTASGNFVEVEDDLLVRTYNSRSDHVGAFGPGWSCWADVRLIARADGAEYIGPDGQRAVFPRMGAGYGRVLGVNALVEPGEGLALNWFGGERWEFDAAGRPTRVTHGPGTDVALSYEDGRLAEWRPVRGSTVRVHWRNERISALEASDGRTVSYRYEHGALVEAPGRHYEIGDAGKVLSVADADGVVEVANAYDDDGRVIHQLSPFGRNTLFAYLPGHVTVTSDDTDGPANVYIHDTHGRLLSLIAGDETRISFQYDAHGNPVAVTDRKGAVTVQEWDERANLTRRVLPTGAEFTFTYDDQDRVLDVTTAGATIRHRYAGAERSPIEIVDAEGGITRLTVHDGLVHAITDPDGVRVAFGFDADGQLLSATDADGNTARLERDAAGFVTAAISPLGRRTTFVADHAGRPLEQRDPDGSTWRFEYSPAGRRTAVIDPLGTRVETRHGEHGETAETVDGLGRVTRHDYDVLGNLVELVQPGGATWRFGHDELCRRTHTTDPAGATWLREYDAGGNLTATTDPVGVRYDATHDRFGRVSALHDGNTSATFAYDALGRCLTQERPDGTTARATYDRLGRRTQVTDPLGGVSRIEYTPAGRIERVTDPSGRVTTFEYDRCGRLARRGDFEFVHDADGALIATIGPGGESERLRYDDNGRVVEWYAPGHGLSLYAYDERGLPVAITDRHDGTRRFAYDAAGQLVAATDANGATTRYVHDDRGRLAEIHDPLGGIVRREYDAVGQLVREIDQLGRATSWSYDAAGRVTARVDGAGRRMEYTYDASGNLATFGTATITRDELGREVGIEEPGHSHAFAWDRAGRLVERRRDGLSLSYRYETGIDLDVRWNGKTAGVVYDAAGQLVAAGGHTFAYDAGGRLVREESADGVVTYEHDAAGQLLARRTERDATFFEYDGSGRRVREYGDGFDRAYRWDAQGRLVAIGDTQVDVDALGELAAVDDVELLWDTADPYSPVVGLPEDDPGPRDPFGAPAFQAPLRGYRGEVEFAGHTWLRARVYDPSTRSFLSPDPLPPLPGTAYATNTYHYAGNDPIGRADPLGLRPVTEQELREIRDRMGSNFFSRNADWIVAGVLIVGGIAVMATGVGGPLGAAMIGGALLSAGSSAAIQKATTGHVNYTEVAVAGLIGGAAGGLGYGAGALVSGSSKAAAFGRGALAGGVESFAGGAGNRAVHGGDPFDPRGMATDLLLGGGIGGVGGRLGAPGRERVPQDIAVNPKPPAPLRLNRPIGRATHNQALADEIANLPPGAYDLRVNQQQVNLEGVRVGTNRPDLQYSLDGKRHYVEFEGFDNPRGDAHEYRLLANDPKGKFELRKVD